MTQTPDHSSRGHAEFSPSSLKYVAGCAGYHGKDGSSAAAEMGTRIHEALEIFDSSALHNEQELSIYEQIVAMEKDFLANFPVGGVEHNEIQVTVDLNGTQTWGTCDRLILFGDKAVMADYKTGISIIDPPEKNWQAKAYTIGAFQKFPQLEEITFVFYVPQHYASLHYTFNRKTDLQPMIDELSDIIKRGEEVRPKWDNGTPALADCTPTVNCRFCRHEDRCPALGGLVVEVAKKLNPQLPDVDLESTEDPAVIEELWIIAKIVSNWSDRLKERAMILAKSGATFPTLQLRSMGAPKKVVDNDGLVAIALSHGLDPAEVLSLASIPLGKITQAVADKHEKSDRKKISEYFVDACVKEGIVETSEERFTLR